MRIINRQAKKNYHILESVEAGIELLGSEVKSLRAARADLSQAFVKIISEEAFLINANIPRLDTFQKNYDPLRSRKLLLHKSQIKSLIGQTSGKGTTLIPLAIYEKHNRFKVEVGLGKSKREFDKRKVIKERDHLRRIEQELRGPKE